MQLDYLPLLAWQRDYYTKPRSMERFRNYIATLTDEAGEMELPLSAMNPMGKDHLLPYLERLVALDADAIGAQATAATAQQLHHVPGHFRVTVVVSDDLLGSWTNRYASEFQHRFHTRAHDRRGWCAPILWSSERYTGDAINQIVSAAIYRLAHVLQHGYAKTLAEMMAQEGYAMAAAGMTSPMLDAEDLAYTKAVLQPYRQQGGEPIVIPALFGDPAARELGYQPLGLSPRAGFALALAEAKAALSTANNSKPQAQL